MPRKEFDAFTRLDASDVNTFLMDQSVMSFAGTAARGSAISSPVEGMVSFLEDSNIMSIYDGSAWQSSVNTTGGILQVVSTAKTDTFSMSSSTFADITGLSATITPKSASSKILILLDLKLNADSGVVTNVRTRLRRASSDIYIGDAAGSRGSVTFGGAVGASAITMQSGAIFLDSPATTSSTTYGVQISTTENGQSVFVNRSFSDADVASRVRTASSITVMEVSA
jgi:hypothetical protein